MTDVIWSYQILFEKYVHYPGALYNYITSLYCEAAFKTKKSYAIMWYILSFRH